MAFIPKVCVINSTENKTAALDRILRGVNFICDAVRQTLGPWGKNVLLEKGLKATNDGLNIAKEINLKDEIEDLGARVAREAAVKTNDVAGDGTTTTLVLLQAILKEAIRQLPGKNLKGKMSVMQLRNKIKEECALVIEKLKGQAKQIETEQELIDVARVSVEDEALAELIGKVQWELGKEGTLIAEESNDMKDSVERINGIRFDNGFGTSLVMNNQEKQRLEVENVRVIMTNYTFKDLKPLSKILDELVRNNFKDIVIIGRAFTMEAIKICMENAKGGVRLFPVNAPYINQTQIMKDLQTVLGGKYYDEEESSLEDMTLQDVGKAKQVFVYRFSAIFTGEKNEYAETRIRARVDELTKSIEGEESIFQKKAIQARIGQLTNGFGVVKVGALSEADRKYKYDKVEDCVHAVKAALEEGTVEGAGLAYKKISEELPENSILKQPLISCYNQIIENAGENFEIPKWVRNSLKVERVALENACEIAASLATSGGAIAAKRSEPIDELFKGTMKKSLAEYEQERENAPT